MLLSLVLQGGSRDWKALVDDAAERHCLFPVESSRKVRSVLSIQSPAKGPRSKTKRISAQANDSDDNSSSNNDIRVHQMDTPHEGSCSGSAVERNGGKVKPVSTNGRELSATVERRARTSAAEMASELLPGNNQRDDHAAGSGKTIANSSRSTRQEQEKHGKDGVRYRDRHPKESKHLSRHRPRSDDHRSDTRRHGNGDIRKRDHHHRNHYRREQENGIPVESKSNRNQREPSRYHSSYRDGDRNRDLHRDYCDRDRDRDRDRERVDDSAFQGRQMEPSQNIMKVDTRVPPSITTLDEKEVSDEDETHCNNGLEIDRQDPHFVSLIENNAAHNMEYWVKLRQQERQSSKSAASPVENGRSPAESEWSPAEHEFTSAEIEFSPAETTESPNETTSTRVPYSGVQPRVETSVTRVTNPGVSRRIETTVSRAPNPEVSPGVETTVSRLPNQGAFPRVETTVRRLPNPGASPRVETTVRRLPNPGASPRVETTVSRLPNPGASPRVETTARRLPNPGASPRVETTVSRVPKPGVQPRVETAVSRTSNAVASTRVEKAVSQGPNPGVSDTSNPHPTRITQHRSSSYSSAATLPSTSNTTHPNGLSRRTSGAAASSFSLPSGPDISQPSTSFGGNRSLDRRGSRNELDPGAQRASDIVRQRHPPVKGPEVIPVSSVVGRWCLHGGSRKRKALADSGDVSSLRQRASGGGGGSSPPKRSARGTKKVEKEKKKYGENFRGRKNWK